MDKNSPSSYSNFQLYVVSAFRRTVTVRLKPDTTYKRKPLLKAPGRSVHFGPLSGLRGLAFRHHSGGSPERDAIRANAFALQTRWTKEGSSTSWKWFGLRETHLDILRTRSTVDGDFEITDAGTRIHERLNTPDVRSIEKDLELLELRRGKPGPEDSGRATRCFPAVCKRRIAGFA